MTRALLSLALILASASALATDPYRPMKVTFQTTDCAGATGMASVDVDLIDRLQPLTCDSGRKLKQVLVKSASGSFEVFTVAETEAGKIEAQIQQAMESRRKGLEHSDTIHINRY
jgi:hypothetical protein